MSSEVNATVQILLDNCRIAKAIKDAVEPDNVRVPHDMEIKNTVEALPSGECRYTIEIVVRGELNRSLGRARSTVDEILAVIKVLGKVLAHTAKEACSEDV